jgi:small subunit ribosomal protein S18
MAPRGRNKNSTKRRRSRNVRPKTCRLCEDKIAYIDFKNTDLLRRYVTEKGKIIPRRITGNCLNHQKALAAAIKRARNVALMR